MQKLILSAAFITLSLAAYQTPAQAAEEEAKATNPVIEAHDAFVADLSKANTRHFNIMYSNYNMIKVVETVRDSVDSAVESCGDNNADLKEPLETRFEQWSEAVTPVLKDADGHINNMMYAQDYAKPKAIKKIFKLIDKTRKDNAKEADKVPVTTPEACTYLLERMDSTQENMVNLLRATLVSLPGKIQVEQEEAEKIEEEKKAWDKPDSAE